jgi:hypothetical protein
MNRVTRLCCMIAVAICASAAAGGGSKLQAQCAYCLHDLNSGTYTCVYNQPIGSTSCGQGIPGNPCYMGYPCGKYSPVRLADGTFYQDSKVATARVTASHKPPSSPQLIGITAVSRVVQRACNGAIVRRDYDAVAALALKRTSRVIRV